MAVVNCYLPDELKTRAEQELPDGISYSGLLRSAILEFLGPAPAELAPGSSSGCATEDR